MSDAFELQREVDEAVGEVCSDESHDVERVDVHVGNPMSVSEFVEMMKKYGNSMGEQ